MGIESRIKRLEAQFSVPGTILTRVLRRGEGIEWTLSLGEMMAPKEEFSGADVEECLAKAEADMGWSTEVEDAPSIDSPRCVRCGAPANMNVFEEGPTRYCDQCAHVVVEGLLKRPDISHGLLARIAEAVGHCQPRGYTNEWAMKWLTGLLQHTDPVVREGAAYGIGALDDNDDGTD